jgi:hypothetical protein
MERENDFRALEQTLRKFAPATIPSGLQRRLVRAIGTPSPLADRILATWSALGAVAAGLIVALSLWQLATTPVPPTSTPQDVAHQQQTAMEYQKIIALR